MNEVAYADVLSTLIEMQGERLVVSYSINDVLAFSFFDAVFERGRSVTDASLLERDEDSIELEFSNGVTLTIDPAKFTGATMEEKENATILKVQIGDLEIHLINSEVTREEEPKESR